MIFWLISTKSHIRRCVLIRAHISKYVLHRRTCLCQCLKLDLRAFGCRSKFFSTIHSVGNFLNFNICFNVWVVFRLFFLRNGHLNSTVPVFDPFSSLKTQFRPCHLPRTYFFNRSDNHLAYLNFDALFEFLGQFTRRCIAYIIFQKDVDNFEIEHKTC